MREETSQLKVPEVDLDMILRQNSHFFQGAELDAPHNLHKMVVCPTLSFSLSFQDRVSLRSPGWPGTHSADQAGLDLRDPPASAHRVQD